MRINVEKVETKCWMESSFYLITVDHAFYIRRNVWLCSLDGCFFFFSRSNGVSSNFDRNPLQKVIQANEKLCGSNGYRVFGKASEAINPQDKAKKIWLTWHRAQWWRELTAGTDLLPTRCATVVTLSGLVRMGE
jgi:hypothetical protein